MSRIKELGHKAIKSLREEGPRTLAIKTKMFLTYHLRDKKRIKDAYKDILFINGCDLPHPQRYRVDHQIEQLEAQGLTCDKVFYADLTLDLVKYYRGFVFYRCPILPVIEEFIKIAKENNKTTFYDIDDLVFDTKYTNKIKYLDEMTKDERNLYDDGVTRMGKTLKLCEYGIASTKRLQTEMGKTLKEVYINRNVASEEMVLCSQKALKEKRDSSKIIMGYFSGSITHNDDFKLIMPTIIKLLQKYDNLYLKIVGLLDLPPEMKIVEDKIIAAPFADWRELPSLIHSVDINLAPLEDTIFNEAKSENKWTEASLVKVPTIASNVGAFKEAMRHEDTGLLCNNTKEWESSLIKLIEEPYYRQRIADQAYNFVMKHYITTYSGTGVCDFILEKLHRNIFFVLPSTNTSGGIMVATRHAAILKKHGYDVTLVNTVSGEDNLSQQNQSINVVSAVKRPIIARADVMVATMWTTLDYLLSCGDCHQKKYLVQNYETDFYPYNQKEKARANATYNKVPNVDYITISKWCQSWLEQDFHNKVKYAPNGIDPQLFKSRKRDFKGRIKILIEGDSKSFYKNTDESFRIADQLDRDKFEIHYLSYDGNPKRSYHYDEFHHKVPYEEVNQIYRSCDILIKSSLLESFSYPPLEMMATGGFCVVAPNGGNLEYLKNGKNCLLYQPGNISEAVNQINRIVSDKELRNKLSEGAAETVASRDWRKIEQDIIKLYE